MNFLRIIREWMRFRKNLNSMLHYERMMKLNFDFNLDNDFVKDDLDKMIHVVNNALSAIRYIRGSVSDED